jgi:hypothetical protein
MKPSYFLIFLVSLSTAGCAGFGNVLAGAASGGATPQCPNRPMTVTQVACQDGTCAAYTVPPPHVAGCP